MTESILQPSQIKMFGRLFDGLTLNKPTVNESNPNSLSDTAAELKRRNDIKKQSTNPDDLAKANEKLCADPNPPADEPNAAYDLLTNQILRDKAQLARIYGFSYEGEYYALPRPTIFMVHGPGRTVDTSLAGELDRSGTAMRDWCFERDVRFWDYDRISYSLRLDIVSGTLDEILIDACMNSEENDGGNADMAARSNLSSRSNVAARSNVSSRSNVSARSNLNSRHRIR